VQTKGKIKMEKEITLQDIERRLAALEKGCRILDRRKEQGRASRVSSLTSAGLSIYLPVRSKARRVLI